MQSLELAQERQAVTGYGRVEQDQIRPLLLAERPCLPGAARRTTDLQGLVAADCVCHAQACGGKIHHHQHPSPLGYLIHTGVACLTGWELETGRYLRCKTGNATIR